MAQLETLETLKRHGPDRRSDWQEPFLESLRRVPNVREACQIAGVGRASVYKERQRNDAFALAWSEALEEGLDVLESVAHARATIGQPMRKRVVKTYRNGTVEVTEIEWRHISDTLLMFMLKRYRPEFRENFRVVSNALAGVIEHKRPEGEALKELYAELDRLAATD